MIPSNCFINNLCSILEKPLWFVAFEPRESRGACKISKKKKPYQYTEILLGGVGDLASSNSWSLLWYHKENEAADKKQIHAMVFWIRIWKIELRVFAHSWIDIDGHSRAKFSDKAIIWLLGFCHYFAFSLTENIVSFFQKLWGCSMSCRMTSAYFEYWQKHFQMSKPLTT